MPSMLGKTMRSDYALFMMQEVTSIRKIVMRLSLTKRLTNSWIESRDIVLQFKRKKTSNLFIFSLKGAHASFKRFPFAITTTFNDTQTQRDLHIPLFVLFYRKWKSSKLIFASGFFCIIYVQSQKSVKIVSCLVELSSALLCFLLAWWDECLTLLFQFDFKHEPSCLR